MAAAVKPACAIGVIWWRHEYQDSGKPWTISTSGPSPSRATRSESSPTSMVRKAGIWRSLESGAGTEADGHGLGPGDEGGGEPLGRGRDLEGIHPCKDFLQDGVDLDAGEVLAQADMRAAAEGDVLVGRAGEVECLGILELVRIAVGGAEIHHHLVAGGDGGVADGRVARRRAAHVDHRARPAQQLLAGVAQARVE